MLARAAGSCAYAARRELLAEVGAAGAEANKSRKDRRSVCVCVCDGKPRGPLGENNLYRLFTEFRFDCFQFLAQKESESDLRFQTEICFLLSEFIGSL